MGDDAAVACGFFAGYPDGLAVCGAVQEAVGRIGDATTRVSKSQVAFRRRRGFAYLWRPGQYISSDVPAVLSIVLPFEVRSDRFKEVVHPSAKVWMHHLELHAPSDVDGQVQEWLTEAYLSAG